MPPDREHIRVRPAKWNRVRLLCYPLAVVVVVRVFGAIWFYHLLSSTGNFHSSWMDANPSVILPSRSTPVPFPSSNWLWLFNGWDSLHFPLLVMLGYTHPDYVFLPGYPALIRIAGLLIGDYWFGAFLVTQFFAFASIVVFQLIAEEYMSQVEALYATLLMATFPYVFVFTTLSYSEAVFLFASLSTWYFYKKERLITSSLWAGITSVTRIYGFVILVPVFIEIVKSKSLRRLGYFVIPLVFIGSWLLFCYFLTGDPIVSWTDEKYWSRGYSLAQTIASQILGGVNGCCALDAAVLVSVAIFAYVFMKIWEVDRELCAYALGVFGALLFTAMNHLSLLRFFSFIFPVWLTVKVRNLFLVAICIALFVPVSLLLWLYAINVTFIG